MRQDSSQRRSAIGRAGSSYLRLVHNSAGAAQDAVYILAAIATFATVSAADDALAEPLTFVLLYAVPVGILGYRFHYVGALLGGAVAVALGVLLQPLTPGTLFFDVVVLGLAIVILSGLMAAKLGSDRAMAEMNDGLDRDTGLASRRAVDGALSMELTRCARYGRPISVLLLGTDAPHIPAPLLARRLKEIGHLLEDALRDVDLVGRYALCELLVILPETHKEDALAVAERLRGNVERLRLSFDVGRETKELTVSAGVASYPDDSLSVEGLLDASEEALFEARTIGGNRIRQARRLQVVSRRS